MNVGVISFLLKCISVVSVVLLVLLIISYKKIINTKNNT